jgi:DNA-binding IclR family transcriptional regulator
MPTVPPIPPKPARRAGTSALARSVAIVKACARRDGAAFGGLRRELDLVPATLARLLAQLQAEGLVAKADGRYVLGLAAEDLAEALSGGARLPRLIQPVVDALADDTRESSAFFEGSRRTMTLLAKREMPGSFHYLPLFGRRGLLEMAFGYPLIAARSPTACAAAIRAHCAGGRDRPTRLAVEVSRARRRGYVAALEPQGGCFRLAAPVGGEGEVVGTVGISCLRAPPASRRAELTERVLSAAAQIAALITRSPARSEERP